MTDLSDVNSLHAEGALISLATSGFQVPADLVGRVAVTDANILFCEQGLGEDLGLKSFRALIEAKLPGRPMLEIREITRESLLKKLGTTAAPKAVLAEASTMQRDVLEQMKDAVRRRASDMHFVNHGDKTLLRYRIDGVLQDARVMTVEQGTAWCQAIYGSMLDQGAAEYRVRERQDGRLHADFSKSLGLTGTRVATRPLEDHNLFVMRLQYPGTTDRMTLPGLGYSPQHVRDIQRMMIRNGVNLLSGSTGSGKTTTLFVVGKDLLFMHNGKIHLATIEDPIEYQMIFEFGRAVQTPKGHNESWAKAIENMMRLDPDLLFVGEIREFEAAMAAIQGAMTGHGLWTTTHAKDAWASLDRLGDLNVPMSRLSDASLFTGLINQSLAPTLCTEEGCAKPFSKLKHKLRDDVRERVERFCRVDNVRLAAEPNLKCPKCGGLGYYDRTVIAEVISPTQRLLNIYKAEGSASARSKWVSQHEGRTTVMHLIEKINRGLIDPAMGEDALRCGLDEDELTLA